MERPSLYFYQLFQQSGASFLINFEDKHNLLVHGVINSLVSHLHYKVAKIHAQNRTLYQNRWYSKNNLSSNLLNRRQPYSANPSSGFSDAEADSLPRAESPDLDLNKLTTGLLYRESRKLKAASSHQPSSSEKQEFYLRTQKLKKELNHFSLCYWGTNYQAFLAWYQASNSHKVIYNLSAAPSWLATIDQLQANFSKLRLLFTHPKLAQADTKRQEVLASWLNWQNQEPSKSAPADLSLSSAASSESQKSDRSEQWQAWLAEQAEGITGKYLLPQGRLVEFWQYLLETNLPVGSLNSEYHTEVLAQSQGEKYALLTQVRFFQLLQQAPALKLWLQQQQLLPPAKITQQTALHQSSREPDFAQGIDFSLNSSLTAKARAKSSIPSQENTTRSRSRAKSKSAYPSFSSFGVSEEAESKLAAINQQYADLLESTASAQSLLASDSILLELESASANLTTIDLNPSELTSQDLNYLRHGLTASQLSIAQHNLNLALNILAGEAKFWGVSEAFAKEAGEAYPCYQIPGYQILEPNNFSFISPNFFPRFSAVETLTAPNSIFKQPQGLATSKELEQSLAVLKQLNLTASSKLSSEQRQLQYQQVLESSLRRCFPQFFVAEQDLLNLASAPSEQASDLSLNLPNANFSTDSASLKQAVANGTLLSFDPYWAKFGQNQTGFAELEQFLTELVVKQRKFTQVKTKPRLIYIEHSLDFIVQSLALEFTGLNFQELRQTYYQALLPSFVTEQPLSEQSMQAYFKQAKDAFLQSQQGVTSWLAENRSPLTKLIRAGREYQLLLEAYGKELRTLCHKLKELGNKLDLQIILNLNLYELSKRVGLRGAQLWKLLDLNSYNSFRVQTNSISAASNHNLLARSQSKQQIRTESEESLSLDPAELLQIDYRDLNFVQQELPALYAETLQNVWHPSYWQRLALAYPQKLISQASCEIRIRGLVAKQESSQIPNFQSKLVPEQLEFSLKYFLFSKQILLAWK